MTMERRSGTAGVAKRGVVKPYPAALTNHCLVEDQASPPLARPRRTHKRRGIEARETGPQSRRGGALRSPAGVASALPAIPPISAWLSSYYDKESHVYRRTALRLSRDQKLFETLRSCEIALDHLSSSCRGVKDWRKVNAARERISAHMNKLRVGGHHGPELEDIAGSGRCKRAFRMRSRRQR